MEFTFQSVSVLVTSILFISLLCKMLKSQISKTALPPGPWKLPVIGNMHVLIGSLPHQRLRELAMKYGPMMSLQLGEVTVIVISSPELAKEILKTHDLNFCQRPRVPSLELLSYNYTDIAFAPYGGYWRQLRKISTLELLSAKRVHYFKQIREDLVSDLIKSILSQAGGESINLSKMIFSLMFTITSRSAFGMDFEEQDEFLAIAKRFLVVGAGFNLADFFPSVKFLPLISGVSSETKILHEEADKVLQKIIRKHMAKEAVNGGGKDQGEDIVDVLLNIRECGQLEFPLSIDNIKAVILDLFMAGIESSSTTVEWAMSELLRNPRVMKKAQEEVRRVFNTMINVCESGIDQLEYLKLVIKETFRLHPSIPLLLPRECKENCEINGYQIPAKSKVIVNAWAIGRDPRHWTEAERFFPERFVDSPVEYKGAHYELIPFGAGRRICPGMSFGLANVELPLAQLLYHFDWKLPAGMNHEDLDMDECFGLAVKRKNDLFLVPVPYHDASQ
ncbi:hypothetical protein ACFE04_022227 [Oxalis oulophora]